MTAAAMTSGDRNAVLDELTDKLAQLTPRVRIRLLLSLGMPAEDVMGVTLCEHHRGWHQLAESASLQFDGTVVWCHTCFRWMTQ